MYVAAMVNSRTHTEHLILQLLSRSPMTAPASLDSPKDKIAARLAKSNLSSPISQKPRHNDVHRQRLSQHRRIPTGQHELAITFTSNQIHRLTPPLALQLPSSPHPTHSRPPPPASPETPQETNPPPPIPAPPHRQRTPRSPATHTRLQHRASPLDVHAAISAASPLPAGPASWLHGDDLPLRRVRRHHHLC